MIHVEENILNSKKAAPKKEKASWFSTNLSLGLIVTSTVTGTIAGLAYVQSMPFVAIGFAFTSGMTLYGFLAKELGVLQKTATGLDNSTKDLIRTKNIKYNYKKNVTNEIGNVPAFARNGVLASYAGMTTTVFASGVNLYWYLTCHKECDKKNQLTTTLNSVGTIGVGVSTLVAFATFNLIGPKLNRLTQANDIVKTLSQKKMEEKKDIASLPEERLEQRVTKQS